MICHMPTFKSKNKPMIKYYSFATVGLLKCSKIGTLWGKIGQIFALVVVGDYGNTTNGEMKNRKCG